jgi:hypothetical protein
MKEVQEYCEENDDIEVQKVIDEAKRRRLLTGETVLDER